MILNQTVKSYQSDDQRWLGSAHGTSSAQTITLKSSAFTAGTHYPNGYLPSGTALGKLTAQVNGVDVYGPYNDAASDGTQTLVGHLFTAVTMPTDNTVNVGAAMFDHGRVRTAYLPFTSGAGSVDAAGKADVAGRIRYV